MKRFIPYIIFVAVFAALQFGSHAALHAAGYDAASDQLWWVVTAICALAAVLLTTRVGPLSVPGTAIGSSLLVLLILLGMAVISRVLAVEAGSPASLLQFVHNFGMVLISNPIALFSTGAVMVLFPCIWAFVVARHARRGSSVAA